MLFGGSPRTNVHFGEEAVPAHEEEAGAENMSGHDPRSGKVPAPQTKSSHGRYKYFQSKKRRTKSAMQQIALERVDILFARALRLFHEDPDLANRYVDLAKRICMVARLRLPGRWRPYVCRGCKGFILPSVNCQVRIQSRPGKGSRVVKTCLKCGHVTRYYLRKASNAPEDGTTEAD